MIGAFFVYLCIDITKTMKKTTLSILLIFIINSLLAQETVFNIKNSFSNSLTFEDVLPIVNKENNDISLLFIDRRRIYNYLIDSDFKVKDSLKTDKRPRKYKIALGSSVSNNDYRVYLSNSTKNKFATINFSFETKKTTVKELDISFDKYSEYFVQSMSVNNRFYILSLIYNSSILNIYSFDDNAKYTKHSIDLSEYEFMDKIKAESLSIQFFTTGMDPTIKLNKFKENSINSLEETSDYTKLYIKDNKFIFTFDINNNFTQILTIDINTYKHSYERINKVDKALFKAKNSNSYLFEDKIFQILSNKDKMYLLIKDLNTKNLLLKYIIEKDKPIHSVNSLIMQYGGIYAQKRTIKTTKQFLRKIATSNIGVMVNKTKDTYQLTFGGIKEVIRGSSGFGVGMGMSFGAIGGFASAFFNPTVFAYGSYTSTKSVNVKSILNFDFKHIDGTIKKNAFDLIKKYNDIYDNPSKGETVFKYKDYYILGHFNYGNPFYKLHKFKNEQ